MNKPKRIVITGALGHIGLRLIYDLPIVFPDNEIIMIGNPNTKNHNLLLKLPKSYKYRYMEIDILNIDKEKILMPRDIVIHLAAKTDVSKSFRNQEEVTQINYIATTKLAEMCSEIGCSLLFPSSTSIYGINKDIIYENCPKSYIKPQNPYAESKFQCENYLKKLGKKKGLKYVICRLGTICGISESMRFHTAVNRFCWQAVFNQSLSIWKTAPNQRRPYLSLYDVSKAIQFIIKDDIFDQNIYNIATDNLTVNEIVSIIKEFTPKIKVHLVKSEIMNSYSYGVSSDSFINKGFKFSGNIKKDIEDTINLLKKQHGLHS